MKLEMTRRQFTVATSRIAVGLMAGALITTTGCGHGSLGTAVTPAVIVEVLDRSASTNTRSIHKRYLADVQKVVLDCTGGEVYVGYPATNNTEATSADAFMEVFPAYNPFADNKDQYTQKLQTAHATALKKTVNLLNGSNAGAGTDLLHAFSDAATIFDGDAFEDVKDKRLIIWSDMIHQSGSIDFMSEKLTAHRTHEIISGLGASGDLPDLSGVTVWVVGATADASGRIPPEKIGEIKRFWLAYFKATHANLPATHYSTRLVNYPITGSGR